MPRKPKKKLTPYALKRIKRSGLPEPAPQLTKAQFKKLQSKWYAKLDKDGFEDIERAEGRFLKSDIPKNRLFKPERELYFQLGSNYLMHYTKFKNVEKLVWDLHCNGHFTTEIVRQLKANGYRSMNFAKTRALIKKIAAECYKWNCVDEEGLFVKRITEQREKEINNPIEFFTEPEYSWITLIVMDEDGAKKARG